MSNTTQQLERELYRQARLHRFRGGNWKSFWEQHRAEVQAAFPVRAERAELVDRLQCIVLLGIRQETQTLLDSVPGIFRGTELEVRA